MHLTMEYWNCIQLFQKTWSEGKQKPFKPRPNGDIGDTVAIAKSAATSSPGLFPKKNGKSPGDEVESPSDKRVY